MEKETYLKLFDQILSKELRVEPYLDDNFFNYVKLNQSRMNRWFKTGKIDFELENSIKNVEVEQNWILITEPWCGDAAHIVPFIFKLSEINPFIHLEIQLRDTNSEIENYLTNGGKSIPKLIVRDQNNVDLFAWGPRPILAQKIFNELKKSNKSSHEQKEELQLWYNQDKGQSLQTELNQLFVELEKKGLFNSY